jgi:hypothetical protein
MKNMLTGESIYPPKTAPGTKRKLTFPPAVGTFESNQKRREALIAKQRVTKQSARNTESQWEIFWKMVIKALLRKVV